MSQFAKVKNVVKNRNASARHRPNKQSPFISCKSKTSAADGPKSKMTRKRKPKCKNCGICHVGRCEEPAYPGTQNRKK